ncbi:MAG: response regulator [Waddliaceae bacterium]
MKKITSKFPGKRVLIAEDYFVNQEVTQDILELMDFEVAIAENGVEALEKHATQNFDAILMDIQMPELDGYEATKEIRKREGSEKHTPIIALTANALMGDREKCLKAGMDDYISKPIEAEKLEEVLKKYLPS